MAYILETVIAIAATPQSIWAALTEAEKITRWFAPEARVTPGLGGTVFLSWGPSMEGEAPITAWEPGRRFAWTEGASCVVEFSLIPGEATGIQLRLTQSGIASAAGLESAVAGWQIFLRLLKLDLERHAGLPSRHVCVVQSGTGLESVLSALSFQRQGDRVSMALPDGTQMEGVALVDTPP